MKCKKCNSELIEYQEGNEILNICPICDETPATQVENLIEYDSNRYTISIPSIGSCDSNMIRATAKLCSCNYLEAKTILEKTGMVFKPMDAIDTRAMKKKLEQAGVRFVITPDFNW